RLARAACAPPLPYTTLFRSPCACPSQRFHTSPQPTPDNRAQPGSTGPDCVAELQRRTLSSLRTIHHSTPPRRRHVSALARPVPRSEEHTSELQSRENLVCRL